MRSLIFINCGGHLDLSSKWFYKSEDADIKSYLIDSHRPYNHKNVNDDSQKILIIHDGCKSFEECPTAEDDRIYHEIVQNEESQDSDDYDSEENDSDEEEAAQELEELKEEGEADQIPTGMQPKPPNMKRLKRQKYIKFQNYYRGSFFGRSASSIFYQLGA